MIVQIRVRNDNGAYKEAVPGDFAAASIRHVILIWGWSFLRLWLGRVCLQMAEDKSENRIEADRWIARYQAVRGIE